VDRRELQKRNKKRCLILLGGGGGDGLLTEKINKADLNQVVDYMIPAMYPCVTHAKKAMKKSRPGGKESTTLSPWRRPRDFR
jgi:hypothetical protein